MNKEIKKATKNTSMMYLMNIAKMIFPLITLPYLTRVLSIDSYAVVAYVKAVMQYMNILLIFGFSLSATKDIVNAKEDKVKIGKITGSVLMAKAFLSCIAFIILFIMIMFIPLLRENVVFTILSFINIVITEMMADFLFRGIDKMDIIAIRFIVTKTIATILTFVFIQGDSQILFIPILDIIGSLVALVLVFFEIRKLQIRIVLGPISLAFCKLKESAIYFMSDMATTAFGALNTLLVGIFVSKADVSYWSLCMQLISAVQSMYTPITTGIYPTMVRTKSIKFIKSILLLFMPIVTLGCAFCILFSDNIVTIVGGSQYAPAARVFRFLVPVLFFSFPGVILGWPSLGAIGRQKETTFSTIITAIAQIIGLLVLICLCQFTLINIAVLRGITELLMCIIRGGFCLKYIDDFNS